MTRLLVQHVKKALLIVESGNLIREPIAISMGQTTPLNAARIDHFCNYLHELIMDPLTTPQFKEPTLDIERFITYGDVIPDILAEAEVQLSNMY